VTAFWRELRGSALLDTDPAKISGGITTSCGDMGSLAFEGVSKNWQGVVALTLVITLTRAREALTGIGPREVMGSLANGRGRAKMAWGPR